MFLLRLILAVSLPALVAGCTSAGGPSPASSANGSTAVKSSPPEANPTAAATTVEPGTALIEVRGMSCPLCANNINNELSDLPGVRKVDVDLGTGLVTVRLAPDSPLTAEQLTNAVRESGFTPGEVRLNQSKPNTEGGQ